MKQRKLNILVLSSDYKPNLGGEAELAHQVTRELNNLGHRILLLARKSDKHKKSDYRDNDQIKRWLDLDKFLPIKNINTALVWFSAMRNLLKTINKTKKKWLADIVFVTSYSTWIYLALTLLRLKFVIFLHGEDVSIVTNRGLFSKWLLVLLCKQAKWIFFNSEYSRALLVRLNKSLNYRSEAVGCGVDIKPDNVIVKQETARNLLGWKKNPVILTVAKLIMRKGIDTVIYSMPKILEKFPDCRYIVVGEGPDKGKIENLIKKMGLEEHVYLLGSVAERQKRIIYSASDIYVMVSYQGPKGEEEGFGITFLEANIHGLPVIGSRCGGIPECVEHDVNGFLVESKQPQQVAIAVEKLLSNSELCRRLARNGQKRIETKFNWPKVTRRIGERLETIAQ